MKQIGSTEVFNRYIEGVLDGSIVACRNVRLACERHTKDLERDDGLFYFDEEIARASVEFVHAIAQHIKGELAGAPFRLSPNQIFILQSLMGWRNATGEKKGLRRFGWAYLTMARKWGKSLFASALQILLAYFDNPVEPGAELYSVATAEDQAMLVFKATEKMVKQAPSLLKRSKITRKSIDLPGSPFHDSFIRPVSRSLNQKAR